MFENEMQYYLGYINEVFKNQVDISYTDILAITSKISILTLVIMIGYVITVGLPIIYANAIYSGKKYLILVARSSIMITMFVYSVMSIFKGIYDYTIAKSFLTFIIMCSIANLLSLNMFNDSIK